MKKLLIIFLHISYFIANGQDTVKIYKKESNYYFDHIVSPKENLYQISEKYQLEIKDIKKNNSLQGDLIQEGNVIRIPFDKKEAKTYNLIFQYIISKGDNLYRISKLFDIEESKILKENQLYTQELAIGKSLFINFSLKRKKSENTEISNFNLSSPRNSSNIPQSHQTDVDKTDDEYNYKITHIVRKKETFYFLAKKYNISVDNLKKWNNINENDIHIGQKLIIKYNNPVLIQVTDNSEFIGILDSDIRKGIASLNKSIKTNKTISKKLALYNSVPIGSYIKAINPENNYTTLVKVIGTIPKQLIDNKEVIIQLTPQVCKALGAGKSVFQVKLVY